MFAAARRCARVAGLLALVSGTIGVASATAAPATPTADTEQGDAAGADEDPEPTSEPAEGPKPAPEPTPTTTGPDVSDGAALRDRHGEIVGAVFKMPPALREDPYGPRPTNVPRLSRAQIVEFGLQNPMVKASDEHIEAMDAQLSQAKFAWIPTIKTTAFLAPGVNTVCDDVTLVQQGSSEGFDFQYCRSGKSDDIDVQTIKGYFQQLDQAGVIFRFSADAVLPLYTFGKLLNVRRGAKELVALAGLKRQQVRQETVLRVYEAHSAVLLARESMTILATAWDVLQQERSKIEKDLGTDDGWEADPEDLNPERKQSDLIELELGEIELAQKMREARKIEGLALAALWAIAGEAAPQGFDIAETNLEADSVAGGLDHLDEYRQMARHNRPEAKMAAAGVKLRKVQEKMARSNFLPDLGLVMSAGVGYGSRASTDVDQLYYSGRLNYSRFYVGLALNWNISFVQDAFALRKARAEHREATHKAEAARMLLALEVEKAFRDLLAAEADMEFTALARDKSWQLLVSEQQASSVGGGEQSDLQKALRKWAEFEFKHFESIQKRNVALAKLSRAVGSPLTDH